MKYFEQIKNLPVLNLKEELDELIKSGVINWHSESQICLNTLKKYPSSYQIGCNSLVYDWDNAEEVLDKNGNLSIKVPEYKNKLKEEDFTVLCSQFKNTIFEKLYNELIQVYKVGRVRLIKSSPKTCLSWHRDSTNRLHFPIKTQSGCLMVIDDEVLHIPRDTWWLTKTKISHTAFNGSSEDRIHLVVSVLNEV